MRILAAAALVTLVASSGSLGAIPGSLQGDPAPSGFVPPELAQRVALVKAQQIWGHAAPLQPGPVLPACTVDGQIAVYYVCFSLRGEPFPSDHELMSIISEGRALQEAGRREGDPNKLRTGKRQCSGVGAFVTVMVSATKDRYPIPQCFEGLPRYLTVRDLALARARCQIKAEPGQLSRIYYGGLHQEVFEFTRGEERTLIDAFRLRPVTQNDLSKKIPRARPVVPSDEVTTAWARIEQAADPVLRREATRPNTASPSTAAPHHYPDNQLRSSRLQPRVTCPSAAGVTWNPGQTYEITWTWEGTGSLPPSVKIDLYKCGSFVETIAAVADQPPYSYSWRVPTRLDDARDYEIRIHAGDLSDYSDNNFRICQDPTVLYPSCPATWAVGGTYVIKWTGFQGSEVKIELYEGMPTPRLNLTIAAHAENDGLFAWTVPTTQTPHAAYWIKITDVSDPSEYDYSDNPFSITDRGHVVYPSDCGIRLYRRDKVTIKWDGFTGDKVKIELHKGVPPNRQLNQVITGETENDGYYVWTVPATQDMYYDYWIKIMSLSEPSAYDFSDNDFWIDGQLFDWHPEYHWVRYPERVPSYPWTGGCGPTSAAMATGYWDNSEQDEAWLSYGNLIDYYYDEYDHPLCTDPPRAESCPNAHWWEPRSCPGRGSTVNMPNLIGELVAELGPEDMGCLGGCSKDELATIIRAVASHKGYTFDSHAVTSSWIGEGADWCWGKIKSEIDTHKRPFAWSSCPQEGDCHFVCAFGYTSDDERYVIAYDPNFLHSFMFFYYKSWFYDPHEEASKTGVVTVEPGGGGPSSYLWLEAPDGGTLRGCSTYDISWRQAGSTITHVTIWYSKDNGDWWSMVAGRVESQPGVNTYSWTVPDEETDSGRIEVVGFYRNDSTNTWVSVASDGSLNNFRIAEYAPPPRPVLTSPAANELLCCGPFVPPILGCVLDFRWEPVERPGYRVSYEFQIASSDSFGAAAIETALTTRTPYQLLIVTPTTLEPCVNHWWRVRAFDDCGTGGWSAPRAFRWSITPTTPELIEPEDTACGIAVWFEWQRTAGASRYQLQVGTNPFFADGTIAVDTYVTDGGTSATMRYATANLPHDVTLYWRVRAAGPSDCSCYSEWSDVWEVTWSSALSIPPALVAPDDGAQLDTLTPWLVWHDDAGPAEYTVQVADNPLGFILPDHQATTSKNTYRVPVNALYPSVTYYWRVIAHRSCGDLVSSHRSFTTPCLPPQADFTASPTIGPPPLTVQFTDRSTGKPYAWSWHFGDGQTSNEQNPVHTYVSAGTYTVRLTASSYNLSCGSDMEEKANHIRVSGIMVTKSPGVQPAMPGASVTFTITYGNDTDASIQSAVLTDPLDPLFTFVSATDGATYDAESHTVSWSLGELAPGETHTVSLTLRVDAMAPLASEVTNQVTLAAPGFDPALSNTSTVLVLAASGLGRGLWMWAGEEVNSLIADPAQWESFLDFCDAPHGNPLARITNLYLETADIYSEAALRQFLAAAHGRGLKVEFLFADPVWEAAHLDAAKAACDHITDVFNLAGAAPERFDGIHLYLQHGFVRAWSQQAYRDLLVYLRAKVDTYNASESPTMTLAADIDWWWSDSGGDGIPQYPDAMEQCDYVVSLAYRDGARYQSPLALNEALAAAAQGTHFWVGAETQHLPNADEVTYFEEGWGYMEVQLAELPSLLALQGADLAGLAIHHYASYADMAAGAQCSPFTDVPPDHWAYPEIVAAHQAGIVFGYSDRTYRPYDPVTRAAMAVFVARALCGGESGVPDPVCDPLSPPFSDISCDHWARKYISYCKDHEIVAGYNGYEPDGVVDRAQMAVFIARAMAGGDSAVSDPGCDPAQPPFPDVPCDFWARKYIQCIKEQGVTSGYPDGLYHPEGICSRDQMAVYITRAFLEM